MLLAPSGNRSRSGKTSRDYSIACLGDCTRLVLMLSPESRGSVAAQTGELVGQLQAILRTQSCNLQVTNQTVFLADPADEPVCRRLLEECCGEITPIIQFVYQPPCSGAALELEAWAIGGPGVQVQAYEPGCLAVSYDGLRWVHCATTEPGYPHRSVHAQTTAALARLKASLTRANTAFEDIVRTWFYIGNITEADGRCQRYKELNRARTDFYQGLEFCSALLGANTPNEVYPASTGIGMTGHDLVLSCLALQTQRKDVALLPLENPQQTPAYAYHPRHSPKSPKFSRAIAMLAGHYATTWISGTASIVDSDSRFPGDIEKQTEQTLDNIERLISAENFAAHGVSGAGARLQDLAKARVYVKRAQDYELCKGVCERRLGPVPVLFAQADVCRPELLVEIEGVAFSRRAI